MGLYEIAVSNTNKIIDKDKRELEYSKVVSAFFKMSIGVVAIAAFLFSLYQQDLNSEVFIKIISVLFSGVFLSFFVLQTNIARIEEKYNISILFNFAAPLLAWIAGFYLAYLGFGGSIFYLGFFVGLLLSIAFFYRYFYGTKIINLYLLKSQKDIYKKIIPFFYVAVFGWLSGYGGNLFVAIFFDINFVGKLTLLLSFGSILQLILTAINQAWAPRFFSYLRERSEIGAIHEINKINRNVYFFQSIVSSLSIVIILFFIFLTQNLFTLQLGSFEEYSNYFLLILLGYSCLLPWYQCHNYLIFFDKGKELSQITIKSGVLGMLIWIALMYFVGEAGIYIGFFIQMILRSSYMLFYAKKQWKITLPWFGYLLNFLLPVICLLLINT